MIEITTNATAVARTFESMSAKVKSSSRLLLTQCGQVIQKDVRHRIETADGGSWPQASKWTRAKKDVNRALQGAEKYVEFRVIGDKKVEIYGNTPPGWTLTQHHKGFKNKKSSPGEMVGGRVHIEVVNPAPLRLKRAGDFEWVPKRAGVTPARKIWTDPEEAVKLIYPVAFRWLSKLASEGTKP